MKLKKIQIGDYEFMKKMVGLAVLVFVLMMFVGGCSDDGDDNSHTECVWGEWVVIRAATCLVGGEETSACNVCSKTRTRPTEVLGHNLSDWAITTPATCMIAGEEISTCLRDNCTHSISRAIVATGHIFGELVETKAATCTEVGERARICSTCGEKSNVQSTNALGHDLGAWDTTKVAVCGGEPGSRTRGCQRTDCLHTVTENISVPSHNWGLTGIITPATCTEAGERGQVCSICGEKRNVTTIATLGHSFGNWTETKPASCDENGEEIRLCTREDCDHSEKRAIQTDCITISTAEDLAALRDQVNAGNNFLGVIVTLANDIQLTGRWTPIGRFSSTAANNRPFRGTFDGNGKTIRGLDIVTSEDYQGLFGNLGANGTIKNLTLTNVSVMARALVGGLVGWSSGIIKNCSVSGSVDGTGNQVGGLAGGHEGAIENCYSTANVTGASWVGGLTGRNLNGTITNSYATGVVIGTNNNIGGLIGGGEGNSIVTSSYATGNVSGNERVGGLVGLNPSAGVINTCYATGTASGASSWGFTGGLAGENSGRIVNCYAMGNVTGNTGASSRTGGLVGSNASTGSRISNSYSTGTVTGGTGSGGLAGGNSAGAAGVANSFYDTETTGRTDTGRGDPKTTAELKQIETFDSWNFNDVWGLNPAINNGYPHLRVFL